MSLTANVIARRLRVSSRVGIHTISNGSLGSPPSADRCSRSSLYSWPLLQTVFAAALAAAGIKVF
jgi:hypothetical protein